MFLVNSRLGHFSATHPEVGYPSPEVTGTFCRVPEREFAQAPEDSHPTYLCRFAVRSVKSVSLNENFLGSWGQRLFSGVTRTLVPTFTLMPTGFASSAGYSCSTALPSAVSPTLLRPPTAHSTGSGMLTGLPSTTPCGLALGAD